MPRNPPQRRSATALRRAAEGESTRTIVIALVANVVIGAAKLIAGLVSGSTAMLAEAAHSAADTMNEVFLAIGLHRARRPADATHPLGHGRERFLWAFMAAIASFLIGGRPRPRRTRRARTLLEDLSNGESCGARLI